MRLLPGSTLLLVGLGMALLATAVGVGLFLGFAGDLEKATRLSGDQTVVLDLGAQTQVYIYEVTEPRAAIPPLAVVCDARDLATGYTPPLERSTVGSIRLPRAATYTPLWQFRTMFAGRYSVRCNGSDVTLAVGAVAPGAASHRGDAVFWVLVLCIAAGVCILVARRIGRRFDSGVLIPEPQVQLPPRVGP
ncbi:MAG: hypothetical protein QOJ92_2628 [Frankiales bacterium]|nr:hypothetical protein [Frankiales bacterium]